MANNFNLKKFLAEGKLLKEDASASDFKKVFDLYSQNTLEVEEGLSNEERQQVQGAIDKAKYNTMDELINSINDVEDELADIMGHYPGEFSVQTASNLAEICNEVQLPGKLNFLRKFLESQRDYGDLDDEEKEESFQRFLDMIGEEEEED